MASPRSAPGASTNGSTNASPGRLATVVKAAEILGITPDAVRSRLRRGTLERSTERGDDGEVLVVLRTVDDKSGQSSDQPSGASSDASGRRSETVGDQSELVDALRDQIALLARQLDEANRANSEHRRLLAAALERIPELEASREGPSDLHEDERGAPETASTPPDRGDVPSEPQEPSQRPERSWWRRFFGFE